MRTHIAGVGVVAALILLVFYVPTAWGGFSAHGTLGCAFGAHDEMVSVKRGGPAARAGYRLATFSDRPQTIGHVGSRLSRETSRPA